MAILCYVSQHFLKDATTHGVPKGKVSAFEAQVEQRQSLAGFDPFPQHCLTKKKLFDYNFRLIAVEKRVDEHLVVVFLRLVVRGGNDYAEFMRDPPTWAGRFYDSELNEERLAAWVAERTRVSPPAPPPSLSAIEQDFLWTESSHSHRDDVILCETPEWLAGISERRVADRLILIPELIVSALDRPEGEPQVLRSKTDPRLVILTYNMPATSQCMLLGVGYSESDADLQAKGSAWADRLTSANAERVLRYSRRSYPSIICCDENMWLTVQRDAQANLALSPEEAEILRSSELQNPSEAAFPLFINGRAGSGKSTLLQYLFAKCLRRWSDRLAGERGSASRPLYFASSAELLTVAQTIVQSLLRADHEHLLGEQQLDAGTIDDLGNCFQNFLQFMRSLYGEDAETRFPWGTYVSYARFRRLWRDRFGRDRRAIRDFGPQISWHVIRGFIKGMSIDGLFERGDYDELPQDERTVSREVYETVHDRVWTAWYEKLFSRSEAWDSQDLVRSLLEEDRFPVSHAAVFCDEAQDFTRLELEAIYRCSLFSDRQIDYHSIKRVPFVFAGDPFQTLNPTGFRWESVRAAFTERLLGSLYRFNSRIEVPRLNYRELTFNYRSSARIVHLCNSIQMVRAGLFEHHSLRPQSTWQIEQDANAPVFFEKGDPQVEHALREQSDLVVIVPCEEGEEIDFVAEDEYLRSFVQSDEDGTPRNVLSAARAKGLEFLRVALYGWSSTRPEARELSKMMRAPGQIELSVDEKLPLEYFMNKLYVAASRARRRLFVIDEKRSLEELWWFAVDEENLLHVTGTMPHRESWSGQTGMLVRGVPESFRDDRDDSKTIAERFEREGLSKEDSYLLKQASQQYQLAGQTSKAHECRGVAHLFDGRYRDAADQLALANQFERAIDAYWRGKLYKEIEQFAGSHPEFAKLARCRMASFIVDSAQTLQEARSLFDNLIANAEINEELRNDLKSPLWKDALQQALSKAVGGRAGTKAPPSVEDAGALADLAIRLDKFGAQLDSVLIARLLFVAGRYEEVLRRLGRDDGSELYRDARALSLIGEVKSANRALSADESHAVAEHYYHHGEFEAASRFYRDARDVEQSLACLKQSLQPDHKQMAAVVLKNTISTLIGNSEWDLLVSLLNDGQPRPGQRGSWTNDECAAVIGLGRREKLAFKTVIPALASSAELIRADGKTLQRVSDYLASHLLKRDDHSALWREVPRIVAGAAIERAGRDIDALKFYELWRDSPASREERAYAERRWVVCKLRQANREERAGAQNKAAGYRDDAATVMKKNGWNEEDVPETFPDLARSTVPGAAPKDRRKAAMSATPTPTHAAIEGANAIESQGKFGPLTYRVFPSKGWINIESDDGLCARVLVKEKKITSNDVEIVPLDEGQVDCRTWGLRIAWTSDSVVKLAIGNDELNISVDGAPGR